MYPLDLPKRNITSESEIRPSPYAAFISTQQRELELPWSAAVPAVDRRGRCLSHERHTHPRTSQTETTSPAEGRKEEDNQGTQRKRNKRLKEAEYRKRDENEKMENKQQNYITDGIKQNQGGRYGGNWKKEDMMINRRYKRRNGKTKKGIKTGRRRKILLLHSASTCVENVKK